MGTKDRKKAVDRCAVFVTLNNFFLMKLLGGRIPSVDLFSESRDLRQLS
jgi:hypothetical protein